MQSSSAILTRALPLYEGVYNSINDLLATGQLRPGEPITESRLAEMLGVSRTPVREAVRRLIAENILIADGKRGLRVHLPTPSDLAEVYFARAVLEGSAAGLAARNSDVLLIQHLSDVCDRCESEVQANNVPAVISLNAEFHGTIVARAGNTRVSNLIALMNPIMIRYRRISLSFREHLLKGQAEHREIVESFRNGDPEIIEAQFRRHILASGGRIVRTVMRMNPDPEEHASETMKIIMTS